MMWFKINFDKNEYVLFVKRISTISAPVNSLAGGEVFKSLIEDKPTNCLVLKGCVKQEEIESRDDYKEIELDVYDEMIRYGNCMKVHCPRPPLFGSAESEPGFGKVYVKFETD